MAADQRPPSSFDDFDSRMRRLRRTAPADERLDAADDAPTSRRSGYGPGVQAGIEIIAGLVFGTAVGYGLDIWLNTAPALLIVFFMLGAGTGVLNAYRTLRRMGLMDGEDGRSS